jgi:hypothetical protein
MSTSEFKAIFEIFESSTLWGGHVKVKENIANKHIREGNRRIICTLADNVKIHAALMPSKDSWFILINKGIQKKLGLVPGKSIQIHIEDDNSEYGMPMPDELRFILEEEETICNYFHELTPGKQRNLIHIVNSVQNQDSRVRKSLAIADTLRDGRGKIDFKMLNERIKWYNQQGKIHRFLDF